MRDTRWDIAKRGHEIPEFGRRFYANEIHTGQSPNVVTRYLYLATDLDRRKTFGANLDLKRTDNFSEQLKQLAPVLQYCFINIVSHCLATGTPA